MQALHSERFSGTQENPQEKELPIPIAPTTK